MYQLYIPIKWASFHPWFLNQSNCVTIIPCTVEWCRCDHSTLFSEHSVQVLQFIPDSFQLYLGQNSAVCHFSPDLSVAHPCNLTVCLFGMDWVARWVLPSGHSERMLEIDLPDLLPATVRGFPCYVLYWRICRPFTHLSLVLDRIVLLLNNSNSENTGAVCVGGGGICPSPTPRTFLCNILVNVDA